MGLTTKVAGGTAALGTSGVAGYAGYKLLVPNTIGEAVELAGKTLISKLKDNEQDSAYQKALDRYLVETKTDKGDLRDDSSMKISQVDNETENSKKKEKLKEYCEATEKSSFSNKDDENYKKVSRWCTQFTSIKEKRAKQDNNKELEDASGKESAWKAKYDTATSDTSLKTKIDLFKDSGSNPEADALKAWCEDTFKRDSEETGLYENAGKCLFKTTAT